MERFLIIILLILYLGINTFAQEEKPFAYKDEGIRDPFVPLVTSEGKLSVNYGAIKSVSDIVLEGIIYDTNGKSIAILSGLILKENDSVGKLKVKKIEKEKVIIQFYDNEYTFKLKE